MNEVFANGTVLILKKDGNSQDLIAFVNESELPKVDLVEYLNQELETKNRLIINDPVEPPISDVLAKILIFLVILFVIGSLFIEIFK